jgi:hypothetical protein
MRASGHPSSIQRTVSGAVSDSRNATRSSISVSLKRKGFSARWPSACERSGLISE